LYIFRHHPLHHQPSRQRRRRQQWLGATHRLFVNWHDRRSHMPASASWSQWHGTRGAAHPLSTGALPSNETKT